MLGQIAYYCKSNIIEIVMPICLHNSVTTLALQLQLQQALSGPQSGKYLQSDHLLKKKNLSPPALEKKKVVIRG